MILDLKGISFHAVVVFCLGKKLLFKSILGRCEYWMNYASVRFNLNLKFNETWNWRKSNLRKSVRRPVASKGPAEHCQINWVIFLWWVQSAPMRGVRLSSKGEWKYSPTVPVCSTCWAWAEVRSPCTWFKIRKTDYQKKSALGADDNEKSDSLPQAQLGLKSHFFKVSILLVFICWFFFAQSAHHK